MNEHEKLFDEICNKLNELSTRNDAEDESMKDESAPAAQPKYEKMQVQMKKFHSDMMENQEGYKEKIKTLSSVSYGPEALDTQLKQLSDQLSMERANSNKLSSDLAKSLELGLQLQLEIQGVKARAMQMQADEKKYSSALLEKAKVLQRDLELNQALKDETAMELAKAKNAFAKEHEMWGEQREHMESQIQALKNEVHELKQNITDLQTTVQDKDQTISSLHQEIEKISTSFNEVEQSASQQNDVLKNLMDVAESKIVEMKLALDKKSLEAQDYYSHLQQALTQLSLHKQENAAMKDYVNKLNIYHQQVQQIQQQQQQNQ